MSRNYYFNIYTTENELLGSVKAESTILAEELAADRCKEYGVDIHEFITRRVTAKEAGVSLEETLAARKESVHEEEKPATDEISTRGTLTVDFGTAEPEEAKEEEAEAEEQEQEQEAAEEPEAKPQPKQKKRKADGEGTEKQLEAYASLPQTVGKWDNAKRDGVRTKYTFNEEGHMIVKTMAITKDGMVRRRELIIGKGGAIHAYGKKPKGTEKLMRAIQDVEKFCYTEKATKADA